MTGVPYARRVAERAFLIAASEYDTKALLWAWQWRVPPSFTPLFVSVMGDWVFGAPDGSLHALSMLDGDLFRIAENAAEYDAAKESERWLDQTFAAGWSVIARAHGLVPGKDECLAWTSPPALGGAFEVSNLRIQPMLVWQTLMGQLHEALTARDGR